MFIFSDGQSISLFIKILIRIFMFLTFRLSAFVSRFSEHVFTAILHSLVFSDRFIPISMIRLLVLSTRDIFPIVLLRGPWDRNERLRILRPGCFGRFTASLR